MSACSNLSTAKSWVIFADQNKLNKLTMIFWGACCNKSALEHRLATKSARIANNSQFRRHMELAVHWIRIPMISIPGCLVYCRLSFPSDFTISLSCEWSCDTFNAFRLQHQECGFCVYILINCFRYKMRRWKMCGDLLYFSQCCVFFHIRFRSVRTLENVSMLRIDGWMALAMIWLRILESESIFKGRNSSWWMRCFQGQFHSINLKSRVW